MPADHGARGASLETRRGCTWPVCDRVPDVSVDYAHTTPCALRLAWLPACGDVNLCECHAGVRRNARSGGRPGVLACEARVTRTVRDALPPENAGRRHAWPGCRRAAGVLLEFEIPGEEDPFVPGWLPAIHQTARLWQAGDLTQGPRALPRHRRPLLGNAGVVKNHGSIAFALESEHDLGALAAEAASSHVNSRRG